MLSISLTKAVLMANLSSYDSDVLSEVPNSDTYQTDDMINQSVQEMQYSEQTPIDDYPDNEITSYSNIIYYSQYLHETQNTVVQDTNFSPPQDAMIMSMFEQMSNQVTNWDKFIDSQIDDMIRNKNAKFAALEQEIDSLKQTLSKHVKEKESLLQTFNIKELDNIVYEVGQSAQTVHMLIKSQVFYDDTHKQALGYQNPFYLKKAQWIKPTLYDGSVISKKHDVVFVVDYEETLILVEESRSKMTEKQNDPILKEKKVTISPINYFELNKLSEDFGKCFVPQKELSTEQAFWLSISNPISEQSVVQTTPVRTEAPSELPKVIMVKTTKLEAKDVSIVKLKKHIENLKGKNVVERNATPNNAKVITPGVFRLDLEPLSPKLLKNRDVHIDYIEHTQEHADTLQELVEHARALM
ncbi:hypothetical protein Tco_1524171 [Tanacetum coccineum]